MYINTKKTVWEAVAQIERKLLRNGTKRGNTGLIFALGVVKFWYYAQGIGTVNTTTHYHYKGILSSSLPVPGWDQSSAQIKYLQTSICRQNTF